MKYFPMRQLAAAVAHAEAGEQALHVHNFTHVGHAYFRRYREAAHLFDQDEERLRRTARSLGVNIIRVEKPGTPRQHIDLCGRPLERAKLMCDNVVGTADRSRSAAERG